MINKINSSISILANNWFTNIYRNTNQKIQILYKIMTILSKISL